jgi:hypothetical protein
MSTRPSSVMLDLLEIQARILERTGLHSEGRDLATEVLACRLAQRGQE